MSALHWVVQFLVVPAGKDQVVVAVHSSCFSCRIILFGFSSD